MFADLYDHRWAATTYATLTAGIAGVCAGLAAGAGPLIAAGGVLFVATGLFVAANLSFTPIRLLTGGAAGV